MHEKTKNIEVGQGASHRLTIERGVRGDTIERGVVSGRGR